MTEHDPDAPPRNTADPKRGTAMAVVRDMPYVTATVEYTEIKRDGTEVEHEWLLDTRWTSRQTTAMRRFMGVTPEDVAVSEASTQRGVLAMGLDTILAWSIAAGVAAGYLWRKAEVEELLDIPPHEMPDRLKFTGAEFIAPDDAPTDVHADLGPDEDPTGPGTGGQSD